MKILLIILAICGISALIFAIYACIKVGAKSDQNNGGNDQ